MMTMSESKRSFSSDDERPLSVKKRKYRKHPKPDANAPKKPSPSAYHLFALEQGDKLRKEGYRFEEIARETGAMWRALSPQEVNALENKTTQAKNRFRKDISAYKRSPEYRAYQDYLKLWLAKEEAKKGRTSGRSNSLTDKPSPPPRKASPTDSASLSPVSHTSGTDELPSLDWVSPTSSQSSRVSSQSQPSNTVYQSFPALQEWSDLPELTTREHMEWKGSADQRVTLAPDPLFPAASLAPLAGSELDMEGFAPLSFLPWWAGTSTIAPEMLGEHNNYFASPELNTYSMC